MKNLLKSKFFRRYRNFKFKMLAVGLALFLLTIGFIGYKIVTGDVFTAQGDQNKVYRAASMTGLDDVPAKTDKKVAEPKRGSSKSSSGVSKQALKKVRMNGMLEQAGNSLKTPTGKGKVK